MSFEHLEAGPGAAGPNTPGVEAAAGSAVVSRVVLRDHHGNHIGQANTLDVNHDGVVSMSEMVPARAEDGHDLAVGGGGLVVGAAVLTAAAMAIRRFWPDRQTS